MQLHISFQKVLLSCFNRSLANLASGQLVGVGRGVMRGTLTKIAYFRVMDLFKMLFLIG